MKVMRILFITISAIGMLVGVLTDFESRNWQITAAVSVIMMMIGVLGILACYHWDTIIGRLLSVFAVLLSSLYPITKDRNHTIASLHGAKVECSSYKLFYRECINRYTEYVMNKKEGNEYAE